MKREGGENPPRTRRCKGQQERPATEIHFTGASRHKCNIGKAVQTRALSQKTCLPLICRSSRIGTLGVYALFYFSWVRGLSRIAVY